MTRLCSAERLTSGLDGTLYTSSSVASNIPPGFMRPIRGVRGGLGCLVNPLGSSFTLSRCPNIASPNNVSVDGRGLKIRLTGFPACNTIDRLTVKVYETCCHSLVPNPHHLPEWDRSHFARMYLDWWSHRDPFSCTFYYGIVVD